MCGVSAQKPSRRADFLPRRPTHHRGQRAPMGRFGRRRRKSIRFGGFRRQQSTLPDPYSAADSRADPYPMWRIGNFTDPYGESPRPQPMIGISRCVVNSPCCFHWAKIRCVEIWPYAGLEPGAFFMRIGEITARAPRKLSGSVIRTWVIA